MSTAIEETQVLSTATVIGDVKASLKLQLAYEHPLMQELVFALEGSDDPDISLCIQSTGDYISELTPSLALEAANETRLEVVTAVEGSYPDGFTRTDNHLTDPTVISEPGAKSHKFRRAKNRAILASKTKLLAEIKIDDITDHPTVAAEEAELESAVLLTFAQKQIRIFELANTIADTLAPRRSRIVCAALGKLGMGRRVLPNLLRSTTTANLHRTIAELVSQIGSLSDPKAIGQEAALLLVPSVVSKAREQTKKYYEDMIEAELLTLSSALHTLRKEGALPQHKSSTLSLVKPRPLSSSGSIEVVIDLRDQDPEPVDKGTTDVRPNDVLDATMHTLATLDGRQDPLNGQANLSEKAAAQIKLMFPNVSVGRRFGKAYTVQPVGSNKGLFHKDMESALDGLMQTREIKRWIAEHPSTAGSVRSLLMTLLSNPLGTGVEKIENGYVPVSDGKNIARRTQMRRFSARKAASGTQSLSSNVSDPELNKLRLIYALPVIDGKTVFMLIDAGHKQGFETNIQKKYS
ncbi:MAG: hypothetical protein V4702_02940 [Patescibacteria group bacterium]